MPVEFSGMVVHGHGRGHELGIPTINIQTQTLDLPLSHGVYCVSLLLEKEGECRGVMNWGPRPTFDENEPTVEVHILDLSGNFYGEKVSVEVGEKLREVQDFETKEALVQQIQADIEKARQVLL